MLRSIGAQIEKTTNREACRDLSGRRLRDINEETRLRQYVNQQVRHYLLKVNICIVYTDSYKAELCEILKNNTLISISG
jgi:hypothetical protein